jgi:hypothetical protein
MPERAEEYRQPNKKGNCTKNVGCSKKDNVSEKMSSVANSTDRNVKCF